MAAIGDVRAALSKDGSLNELSVDGCSGIVVERFADERPRALDDGSRKPRVIVIRIDKPGEESIFLQVRAVGERAELRMVVLEKSA